MSSATGPPGSAASAASVDARARELRACATRRWLVKDELVFLLQHHRQQLAVPCLHSLQPRPRSGTLLFYDVNDVADFKKDGWRWQKRKDNSGRVREDRAKLVINREVIILGTYVHSAEIPTFHRRNYYLRDSNQHVMLVHYFDEVHKIDPSMGALVPPKAQPLPRPTLQIQATAVSAAKSFKRPLAPTENAVSFLPPAIKMDPYDANHSVDVIMKDCFAMDYNAVQDQSSTHNNVQGLYLPADTTAPLPAFEDDETLFSELSSLLSPAASASQDLAGDAAATPVVEISDFSPDWDFVDGGAKILLCLASALPASVSSASGNLFVQFGTRSRTPAERVSDTVIRCSAPRSAVAGPVDLFVCACSSISSSDCLQLSTTGRFHYKSMLTSPSPGPMSGNENLLKQLDTVPLANGTTALGPGKRGRSPGAGRRLIRRNSSGSRPPDGRRWSNPDCINLSAFVDTDLDERQCKIRVVERLAEFQDAIRTTSASESHALRDASGVKSATTSPRSSHAANGREQSSDIGKEDDAAAEPPAALDDGAIEALSDRDLESLSEQLIENVVRQLVTVAHTSEELLDELNSLDETGLSLLHYVSFYNYSHLIPLLLSHGAQVNQQSTQGQTPLHLAAGCGHEQVVIKLMDAGADAFALDFDGFTPAERADKSGHPGVVQQLRKRMGDMMVVDGTFDREISSGGMWNDSMDDMEVDEEDGGYFSVESSQERFALTPETTTVESDVETRGVEGAGCGSSPATRTATYAGENQEHNRKLLLGAFSTMSLHDKCALSLSISRDLASSFTVSSAKRRGSSISEDGVTALMITGSSSASSPSKGTDLLSNSSTAGGESDNIADSEVKSVIADDEDKQSKLEAAMELMGPEERQSLEDEARVIQHNVRAWFLRRNCRNMRETTKRLHEAAKSIEDQQKSVEHRMQAVERQLMSQQEMSERERAAVTVQAAARSMLARKSFLQTRNVTIKVQAATRGVLCRKNFARMKTHALASLVIQRNVREWLSKQPGSNTGRLSGDSMGDASTSTITAASPPPAPRDHVPGLGSAVDILSEDDEALVRELSAALSQTTSPPPAL